MSEKPEFVIFPDLNVVIRTPAGREYRGKVMEHPSQKVEGEVWHQVVGLRQTNGDKHDEHSFAVLRQAANKGQRPDYFPAGSTAMPLEPKLNRIPVEKRNDRNADTEIGELWDIDGLWTILAKPSKSPSVLFAGSVVPAKVEVEANAMSRIAQYQRPTAPGEMPVESVAGKPGATIAKG